MAVLLLFIVAYFTLEIINSLYYPSPSIPDGMTAREYALRQSRSKEAAPNMNFRYCSDGGLCWKVKTWWFQRRHTDKEMCDNGYHTCINTATMFYNPRYTAALCSNFVKNPKKWHFKEVER